MVSESHGMVWVRGKPKAHLMAGTLPVSQAAPSPLPSQPTLAFCASMNEQLIPHRQVRRLWDTEEHPSVSRAVAGLPWVRAASQGLCKGSGAGYFQQGSF